MANYTNCFECYKADPLIISLQANLLNFFSSNFTVHMTSTNDQNFVRVFFYDF